MIKNYIVFGTNWVADVDLTDVEYLTEDESRVEAATRAVEYHFGKYKKRDVFYSKINDELPNDDTDTKNELADALKSLLVTEIEPGIGIGALLCITRLNEDQSIAEECLVNSKMILDNAGIPSLSAKWEQKFGKTSKTS